MPSELEELIEFLSSPRLEVRKAAVEIVQGLSGSDAGVQQLAGVSKSVTKPLLKLLGDRPEIAQAAATSLVNLTQDARVVAAALKGAVVERAMEGVRDRDCGHRRLLVMLLANVTQREEGARMLLQVDGGPLLGLHVCTLLRFFAPPEGTAGGGAAGGSLPDPSMPHSNGTHGTSASSRPDPTSSPSISDDTSSPSVPGDRSAAEPGGRSSEGDEFESTDADEFEHAGAVLVNVSRLKEGRELLLNPHRKLMRLLLPQVVGSANVRRRQAVASVLRNCCFDAGAHLSSLLLFPDLLFSSLLLPLAGRRAFSAADLATMPPYLSSSLSRPRMPERDPAVRVAIAEALLLLAGHEAGRRSLWEVNAPRILQQGYEDEAEQEALEAYERLGELLVTSSSGPTEADTPLTEPEQSQEDSGS